MNQSNQQHTVAAANAIEAINFCHYWGMASAALNILLPNVPSSYATLKTAITALIAAGNAVCASPNATASAKAVPCPCQGDTGDAALVARRRMAEDVLNKAALEPEWKAQLLSDPRAALAAAGFDVSVPLPGTALDGCDFSCILST
ncbi:hypothetical protein LSO07_13630 [Janthinobacterium sp. PLB04]|uniref:Uncharacterized protein n=1 Tax=Janthinobacterium lividum TaxID=29581 RepID=A0AAJ4MX26_9BURK|nr:MULTISPECIES: hypothetical protein [Janthinobacterium]QSX98874.1 hypothetical protein J3P46_13780 [Janthinobacterium lividum]UGQ38849.1 hypothetical protein LSO07_13630 [Janthinobacterium sp. PLB04]